MDFMDHTLDIMPEKKIALWLKVIKIFSCGVFVCYAGGCTQCLYMQGKHGLVNYILL